jgi:hypothetical protein
MESVRHLDRLWSSEAGSRRVITSSITTDQFNLWMCGHPSRSSFRLAVGQDVNHLVVDHIDKDGTEFSPPTEREVIYPEFPHWLYRFLGKRHDPTKNGHKGGS